MDQIIEASTVQVAAQDCLELLLVQAYQALYRLSKRVQETFCVLTIQHANHDPNTLSTTNFLLP